MRSHESPHCPITIDTKEQYIPYHNCANSPFSLENDREKNDQYRKPQEAGIIKAYLTRHIAH